MFQNHEGELWIDNQGTSEYTKLIDPSIFRGRWHMIEINAKWSKDDDGFMKIYVNGELKFDHKGRAASADTLYFKCGIYRSFMSRYKNHYNVEKVPGQTVYYTNVKHGGTRQSIQP